MEKLLMNPYDKEYMKMAMLKHEETFREQVFELHRLYQIQKLLMKNIAIRKLHVQELGTWNLTCEPEHHHHEDNINNKNNNNNNNNNNIPKRPRQFDLDLERPAASGILDNNEDETELELTLGPASQYSSSRRRKKKNSLGSDSAVAGAGSFSSSSTGSSNIIISNNKMRANLENHNHHQRVNRTRNSSSEVVVEDDEEQLMIRQDRHANPPWLFHALSLNTS